MRNTPLVVGLDLGGTKIAAGVVASTGKLLSSIRLKTPASGVKRDVAALYDAARAAAAAAQVPWREIRAVGVGVPGAFDPETETVWAPNLPGWKRVPLGKMLGRALRRLVFVEGDRNVQALAEAWLGAGRGRARNLVFLTLGTGIGAGLILDGRLVPGTRGVAGAAGWMAIEGKWRPVYARIGCLEARGAGPAVARLAQKAVRSSSRSLMRKLAENRKITAHVVAEAARRGDRTARRVLDEVGTNLGRGVASIISLLNPELVVVGGGLAGAGELILTPLRRAARQWGQPLASRQARIVRSRVGDHAGVLGAARYAFIKLEGKA
ncbi:MAG: ROK family protein [Acidobacteria bacterium]|nr:ROK family protein [Acidobacteriota bacterium]